MVLKNIFLGAIIGVIVGATLGIVASLFVSTNNYRVMFLMTFVEVGLIVGLLSSAKTVDAENNENQQ